MNLAQLGEYFRSPPVLFEIVDDELGLAHARYRIAWYEYILIQARDYEPQSVSRYIRGKYLRKIRKWQVIEAKLK